MIDLQDFSLSEKMVYLILKSDEQFELRFVDYYSIRYSNSLTLLL